MIKMGYKEMLFYSIFSVEIVFVVLVRSRTHQAPIPDTVWSERCKKNTYVLNDCNWCWCTENHYYQCNARICEQVDMFGHFKDTILETDVGMEGHGVWRSRATACTPGMQYRRDLVHCICDEDGDWPNPVCRDLFRILHSVEVTDSADEATSQTCSPTKLYLVGCNACYCPSSGTLNASLCTNRTCTDDDPVLAPKEPSVSRKTLRSHYDVEIYAVCKRLKTYRIGPQKCKCLGNNRLLCGDLPPKRQTGINRRESLCTGRVGDEIVLGCNLCKCQHDDHNMYCTAKRCLAPKRDMSLTLKDEDEEPGELVDAPVDDYDCVPGTRYQRNCNTCQCKSERGKKVIYCTVNRCQKSKLDDIITDCVAETFYEKDCYSCRCKTQNGVKIQSCIPIEKCGRAKNRIPGYWSGHTSVVSLHGYCEPMHDYKEGCNECKCLASGKIVKCTTWICSARSTEPVEVDIVPLQAEPEPCPEGFSYKVGCNVCYCLSNGNALCTTKDCSKQVTPDLNIPATVWLQRFDK